MSPDEAFFQRNELTFRLQKIKSDDMTKVLSDKQRRSVVGYPMYFDCKGRLWPKPQKGIKVVFT